MGRQAEFRSCVRPANGFSLINEYPPHTHTGVTRKNSDVRQNTIIRGQNNNDATRNCYRGENRHTNDLWSGSIVNPRSFHPSHQPPQADLETLAIRPAGPSPAGCNGHGSRATR